jgi:dipeptidyl-peptidase-4
MKNIIISLLIVPTLVIGQKKLTLEDAWLKYSFYPKSAQGFNVQNNGLTFVDVDGEDSNPVLSQFEIKSGKKIKELVKQSEIKFKDKTLDLNTYQFNPTETKLLLSEGTEYVYRRSPKANYFVYDIASKSTTQLTDKGKQLFPTFSPDGNKIAYVRENNLYILNLMNGTELTVTTDGEFNKIKNGWGDWVYEEEFSKADYFSWSADGTYLAYVKFNEINLKEYTLESYNGNLYPDKYTYKYPKAGEDNSIVSVHIFDAKTNKTVKADIGAETDIYIPRIQFTNEAKTLSLQRLNRLQNKWELLFVDATNGSSKIVLTDESKTYIDITDDLLFIGNKGFITSSERDNFNHLYYYDLNGKLINQITSGPWDVIEFKGLDEKTNTVYFTSTENGAINRDVYSILLTGKNKKRLSTKTGFNSFDFTTGFKYYISSYSNANTPPVYELCDINGKVIKVLEDNKALSEKMKGYTLSQRNFFKFKTGEGVELNGWMMKPHNFDSTKKYPVYMYAYNGPGANEVNNSFDPIEFTWHNLLCQEGYMVVCVDGRGTFGRGREFKHSTYLQLGKLETIDQIETAKYLSSLTYVDKTRIGFQGWSYGGFMACNLITKGADYFKATIAVAPVTNWKYYDNIYTERFMRKPADNKSGYDDNSPITHVKKIKGKFLLIHGSSDDNVHVQNSMELVAAMVKYNIPFDYMIYPNKNHGIAGGMTRMHVYGKILKFVKENL